MINSDFNDFERVWSHLCELYGKPTPGNATMKLIFGALMNFTAEQVGKAASYYIRTGKFMPRPADIAEIISGTANERARAAFVLSVETAERIGAWKSVRFNDDNIMSVIYAMGGWSEFCHLLKTNRAQTETRFVKWHETAQNTHKKMFPTFLQGLDTTDKKKIEEVKCNVAVCGMLALPQLR